MKNLTETLSQHKLWLEDSRKGQRANLRYTNLRGADLRYTDLRDTDLRYTNLRYTDLRDTDLRSANLRGADLRDTDLQGADLRDTDLRGADLRDANLQGAKIILFRFNRDQAYYLFDDKIRIGGEYHSIDHWLKHFKVIGTKQGYSSIEIKVYGNFITQCKALQDLEEL